MVIEGMD